MQLIVITDDPKLTSCEGKELKGGIEDVVFEDTTVILVAPPPTVDSNPLTEATESTPLTESELEDEMLDKVMLDFEKASSNIDYRVYLSFRDLEKRDKILQYLLDRFGLSCFSDFLWTSTPT